MRNQKPGKQTDTTHSHTDTHFQRRGYI